MMPGLNAPPMHPRCHCSTAPLSIEKNMSHGLIILEKGGTTEEWKAQLQIQIKHAIKSYSSISYLK